MRSPLLAAARSYIRPLWLLALAVFAQWLFFVLIQGNPEGWNPRVRNARLATITLSYAYFLQWLAFLLVTHLKEMLGSPTSRLTPRLARLHLRTALLIVAVFTLVVPAAVRWAYGFHDLSPHLFALSLTAFATAAAIAQWWPACWAVLAFWSFAGPLILRSEGTGQLWWPTALQAAALLAGSAALLAVLAHRLSRFHEEMGEYERRIPTTRRQMLTGPRSQRYTGGWSFPLPVPRNLRALARGKATAEETLLDRARHFHAAWRSIWAALVMGAIMGAMEIGLQFFVQRARPGGPHLIFASMPFIAMFPLTIVTWSPARKFVLGEFLRPYTRPQFLQAIGAMLGVACLCCWLMMCVVPWIGAWLLLGTSLVGTRAIPQLLLSACSLPLLYAAYAWPWRSWGVVALCTVVGVQTTALFIAADRAVNLSPIVLAAAAAGMLALGAGGIWLTYRRWLNGDAE